MYSKMKTYPFTELFYHRQTDNTDNYTNRLKALCLAFEKAEYIVIGAGAGLSAAAGLEYAGKRFTDNFSDFLHRYHIKDMYSAMFYPFRTEEERWAYMARHIRLNRYDNQQQTKLYRQLLHLIKQKNYFVITTNVDALFEKAGFAPERIFAVQGDYAYLQCAKACHNQLYYNETLVRNMDCLTTDCKIPMSLIPHCPICGGKMEINIRKDEYFVQDNRWQESFNHYRAFMQKAGEGNTLLLELGVGYNTPGIIRFPFERLAEQKKNITLARINRDYPEKQTHLHSFLPFTESIDMVIADLNLYCNIS